MSIGIGPGIGVGIGGSGGGTGFPSSLTAAANGPILSISGGLTSYPPVLTVDLLYGVQTVGDTMRVVAASDVAFTDVLLDTSFVLTGTPATDTAALNAAVAGLSSPAVRYIRVHCIGWSNMVMHGNATPATITSSATPSVDELAPLAFALTANQPIASWALVGGADYAYFTVDGATLSFSSGVGDFEVQPTYGFVVRATNLAGLTTDQVCTLTLNNVDEVVDAFAFTDQTEVALSTLLTSNTITISGLATTVGGSPVVLEVPGTITGAEWNKNGTGWNAAGSTTFKNSDTLQLRMTSAALDNTQTSATVNIGGVTDTWTITTPVPVSDLPQSGSVILDLVADDLTTLFQNNAGTGAVAADSDVVGMWQDKSANAFHLTSVANDNTRPVWRSGGGYPYVETDGINDVLRRLEAMDLWAPGGVTIAIAMRASSPAVSRYPFAGGNSSQTNTILSPFYTSPTTAADAAAFYRADGGANIISNQTTNAAAFDGNDTVLVAVDNGSSVTVYQDGVAGTARAYTRGANAMTTNIIALGALVRGNPQTYAGYMAMRVHRVTIWATPLDATDRAAALTALAAKQGRTL